MSIVITELVKGSITHTETAQTVPAGQAPRGMYFETEHYDDECWYIKNHYDDPDLVNGFSTISITNRFGAFVRNINLDLLVYRIRRSSISQQFLALSFNLRLHYYSTTEYYKVLDISENIPTRYHVQCIDLSNNGEVIFYSNWNSIIRLDHNLEPLKSWKITNNFNRDEKASVPAIQQALEVLELQKNPETEQIKSAYRKKLLNVHPDINRNDPYACDKTRSVVEAYEVLTRGAQTQSDSESIERFIQFRFAFEGDSVTAIHAKAGTEDLFVGSYSGKLYLLERSGRSNVIYESHAPIRNIRESGKYIYIVSDHFWDILVDGVVINRIDGSFRLERSVFDGYSNAVMSNRKSVRLYSPGGIAFAQVNLQENISDVFMLNQKLRIVTGKKSYIFSIVPPTDSTMFSEHDLFLPNI